MDIFIFIAFCFFMLMVGMRLRDAKKADKNPTASNANPDEPEAVRNKREQRQKRGKYFSIFQLFVLAGLIVFMSISLYFEVQILEKVDMNFILKCVIFFFAIYILYIGCRKLSKSKQENNPK